MDKKKRNKGCIFEKIVLFFVCFLVLSFLIYVNTTEEKIEDNNISICEKITKTPAWVDRNDNIIKYGLISIGQSNKNFSDDLTQNLIDTKVKFVYNSDCYYCKLQIDVFGDYNFNKLKEKGLALDCKE